MGIVPNYVISDWKQDIASAQETGIDAFALNCAPTRVDFYTPKQLAYAYQAAAEMSFKVFISFDFAYWNEGDRAELQQFVNLYANHPAQYMYNGGALVSTFIGDDLDWAPVKESAAPNKIYAIPNQQDPYGPYYRRTHFDGVFSWYAWPTSGGNQPVKERMSTKWDDIFTTALKSSGNVGDGSTYMAREYNEQPHSWNVTDLSKLSRLGLHLTLAERIGYMFVSSLLLIVGNKCLQCSRP